MKKFKYKFLKILLYILNKLANCVKKLFILVNTERQYVAKKYYRLVENNIVSLEDLCNEFLTMSQEELIKILYVITENMEYLDPRAEKIQFLKIYEEYYVSYELIFFNILQIIQPSYKEFAIKYFGLIPERNSVSFDKTVMQKYCESLYASYCITDDIEKRKYMKLSIADLYFHENLLKIPKEIAVEVEKRGVTFQNAITENNYRYCRECKFFYMSYKYISLRDNVQ